MSESLRSSKNTKTHYNNAQLSAAGAGAIGSSQQQQQHHHAMIPHKFSSIVNKVESLIHKINPEKSPQHELKSHKQSLKDVASRRRKDTTNSNTSSSSCTSSTASPPKDIMCFQCDIEEQTQKLPSAASLDSLNNLSDGEQQAEEKNGNDFLTDSDDAEIAHITGTTAVQVHQHRRLELDQLNDETIREFNEQCSSLSHDMEFYNSWQNEEELEQQNKKQQQQQQDTCDELQQQQQQHMYEQQQLWIQHQEHPQHLPLKMPPHEEYHPDDATYLPTDNNNNNDCFLKASEDALMPDWSERPELQMEPHPDYDDCPKGRQPLTHIQQIVNNITHQQQQLQNINNIMGMMDGIEQQSNYLTLSQLQQQQQQLQQNALTNGGSSKTRRSSVASSGSVGRMETIVEEPPENKISVREILQRFETMNKNETQSKASTLSSGVRAAAQTLNVPIERLESRQSNHRETLTGATNNGNNNNNNNAHHQMRNASSPLMTGSYEETHHHNQQQQQQQQMQHQQQQMQQQHSRIEQHLRAEQHSRNEMHSRNMHHSMHDVIDLHQPPVSGPPHHFNGHNEDEDRLIERDNYGEHHQYAKQQSYLHSGRKQSSQQQQQQQQYHGGAAMHAGRELHGQQNLDANYMAEEQNGGGGGGGNGNGGGTTSPSVTRYSLLQFAMQHFRNDQIADSRSHGRESSERSSNRSYAELVKWQGAPIRMPLLRLPNDLAPLALECFECILCYCGDIPMDPELTEVKCVYTVLMHCHKYLALRDEVYCQLMKQTTANRSPCPDSTQRGWRLLSILAAYFGCSDALRPYLLEHLTSAASDRRRSCHGTAAVCLTNLRKTARCGGRKNVPSVEEVTAVSAGRSARRQIYRLPGGAERVVNTRCSTVVADVIAELCALLGIDSETEQQEFSLYCIVQGDAFTMPLAADEYILDVTTELLKSGQPFYLIFCRSVWHFALKRDPAPTPLYVEVLFNQVAPDYLEGLLLELPSNGVPPPEVVRDMARIAALLHRAADLSHVPAMKEIKFLLPKPALGIREIRPAQWVGLVQSAWPQIANLSPGQVKAQFLNVLSTWPLFGSSFFAVKRIWAEEGPHVEDSPMWKDLILALNRRGVLFLDPNTHETMQHWPFMEVISTRKVRSEDGALFLDMKVGNLMQQRVIRVQTEQAHEISRLVRQYITMAQISQRDKRDVVN